MSEGDGSDHEETHVYVCVSACICRTCLSIAAEYSERERPRSRQRHIYGEMERDGKKPTTSDDEESRTESKSCRLGV